MLCIYNTFYETNAVSLGFTDEHTIRLKKLAQDHIVNNWQSRTGSRQINSGTGEFYQCATLPCVCCVSLELPP